MKQDKAFLNIHGKPQWKHVYEQLKPFCQHTVVSVNPQQNPEKFENYPLIIDADWYQNHGPVSGLLSVHEQLPEHAVLFAACDYPNLNVEHLLQLVKNRNPQKAIICFENNGMPEPMIALFEPAALQQLKKEFLNGRDSVFSFIKKNNPLLLQATSDDLFINLNTPEDLNDLIR